MEYVGFPGHLHHLPGALPTVALTLVEFGLALLGAITLPRDPTYGEQSWDLPIYKCEMMRGERGRRGSW